MNHHPVIIPAIAADGSLYPVEKLMAHVEGLFHLAVSVFVFDGDRLLIQQRAHDKYHCGGMWANTCCTHPYWDEAAVTCAERRSIRCPFSVDAAGADAGATAVWSRGAAA